MIQTYRVSSSICLIIQIQITASTAPIVAVEFPFSILASTYIKGTHPPKSTITVLVSAIHCDGWCWQGLIVQPILPRLSPIVILDLRAGLTKDNSSIANLQNCIVLSSCENVV